MTDTMSTAVKAIKNGCRLYFKTFNPEEVLLVIVQMHYTDENVQPTTTENPKRAKQPVEKTSSNSL
jgi:hypothetical protein